jgi:hypothetical protein
MRVIHGIWAHGALCLWAEDPGPPPVTGPVPQAGHLPRPHPFACQAAELSDMLAGLAGPAGEAARKAVDGELTLRLPSAADHRGPLASPQLIRPDAPPPGSARSGPRGRVSLAGWRVPVLAFAPAAALDLLGAVGQLADLAAAAGESLPYLAAVARFAGGLAARGRVLPVIAAEDGGYAARWRPVLGGADAQRARDLAAAMPPSCRAAGGEPPGPLLSAALGGLTDAAARIRLPASLLPARRGRTPARLAVRRARRGAARAGPGPGGAGHAGLCPGVSIRRQREQPGSPKCFSRSWPAALPRRQRRSPADNCRTARCPSVWYQPPHGRGAEIIGNSRP